MNKEEKLNEWIEKNTGKWRLVLVLIAISLNLLQFFMLGHDEWIRMGFLVGFIYAFIFILMDYISWGRKDD